MYIQNNPKGLVSTVLASLCKRRLKGKFLRIYNTLIYAKSFAYNGKDLIIDRIIDTAMKIQDL